MIWFKPAGSGRCASEKRSLLALPDRNRLLVGIVSNRPDSLRIQGLFNGLFSRLSSNIHTGSNTVTSSCVETGGNSPAANKGPARNALGVKRPCYCKAFLFRSLSFRPLCRSSPKKGRALERIERAFRNFIINAFVYVEADTEVTLRASASNTALNRGTVFQVEFPHG